MIPASSRDEVLAMNDSPESTIAATERRSLLSTASNPTTALDYLNHLEGHTRGANAYIVLRYVPDKLTLPPASFTRYLNALDTYSTKTLEQLAVAILEDVNNELVPRWAQIVATRDLGEDAGHRILIEDRQPKWDNPALLARMERF